MIDLKEALPEIKTQGQYDAAALALKALLGTLAATFKGDATQAAALTKGLLMALEGAKLATSLAAKVEGSPEAVTTTAHTSEPKEFLEEGVFAKLMGEMNNLSDSEALKAWYQMAKPEADRLVSSKLRNAFYDAFRAKVTEA